MSEHTHGNLTVHREIYSSWKCTIKHRALILIYRHDSSSLTGKYVSSNSSVFCICTSHHHQCDFHQFYFWLLILHIELRCIHRGWGSDRCWKRRMDCQMKCMSSKKSQQYNNNNKKNVGSQKWLSSIDCVSPMFDIHLFNPIRIDVYLSSLFLSLLILDIWISVCMDMVSVAICVFFSFFSFL